MKQLFGCSRHTHLYDNMLYHDGLLHAVLSIKTWFLQKARHMCALQRRTNQSMMCLYSLDHIDISKHIHSCMYTIRSKLVQPRWSAGMSK